MKNLRNITLVCAALISFTTYAQDDCAGAVTVTDLTGTNCTTSSPSTTNFIGSGTCEEGNNDTWFQFTAQGGTADITVSSTVNNWNPEIVVASGNPASTCAGYTQEACADANGNYNSITLTGLTGLNIGETYWIIVSSGNNSSTGTLTVCVDNPAVNPCATNENCTNPSTITLNAQGGGAACVTDCNTGASAGPDFTGNNCFDLPNATVWYTFTTDPGVTSIDLSLTSGDLSDPEYTLFTTADCLNYTIIDCQEGTGGSASSTVAVTGSTTYILAVSDVTADEGNFDICVTQNAAAPGSCTDNEECTGAEALTLNGTSGGQACFNDCTTGATPGLDFIGPATCSEMLDATVWYTITTDAGTANIDITLTSGDLSDPEFAVFTDNGCTGTWTTVACNEGSGGSSSLTNIGVASNTTYIIAVSDATGDEGNFTLCIEEHPDNSACNVDNTLAVTATSMGSPLTGPFQPGEIVTFCYTINAYTTGLPSDPTACNYLQGIVPTFGDCWDPVSFDGNGMPTVTSSLNTIGTITDVGGCNGMFQDPWCPCAGDPAGIWSWYPSGSVDYNLSQTNAMGYTTGDDVGAGWFFTTDYNSINGQCTGTVGGPDNSYGDNDFPQCNDLGGWNVCFQLQAKDVTACGTGEIDCSVSVKTFADGEIGVWASIGCTADQPTSFPAALNCALPVELGELTGEFVDMTSIINWTTVTEDNTSHFVISHAGVDGDFVEIGQVKAVGNSEDMNRYRFIDYKPLPGINYYNLRAVDFDGTVKDHGTISINADFQHAYYDYDQQHIVLTLASEIEIYSLDGKLIKKTDGIKNIPFTNKGIFLVRDLTTGYQQKIHVK